MQTMHDDYFIENFTDSSLEVQYPLTKYIKVSKCFQNQFLLFGCTRTERWIDNGDKQLARTVCVSPKIAGYPLFRNTKFHDSRPFATTYWNRGLHNAVRWLKQSALVTRASCSLEIQRLSGGRGLPVRIRIGASTFRCLVCRWNSRST